MDVANGHPDVLETAKKGELDSLVLYLQTHSLKELYNHRDNQGHTAIHWACLHGHTNLVKFFIDVGAYMSIRSSNSIGKQPIHWACANGHLPIVSLLLQTGVDVNATDQTHTTPLLTACQFGHTMLANYLICKGAHFHIKDQHGNTPLHWAAFRGLPLLLMLLLTLDDYRLVDSQSEEQAVVVNCREVMTEKRKTRSGYLSNCRIKDQFKHLNQIQLSLANTPFLDSIYANQEQMNSIQCVDAMAVNNAGESAMDLTIKYKNKNYVIGRPGNSTIGVWFYLVNVVFWGYPMYLYHGVPVTWSTMKYSHCLFFISNAIMWSTFFIAHYVDPGFVVKNGSKYHTLVNQASRLDDEIRILLESEGLNIRSEHLKGRLNPLTRLCHSCRDGSGPSMGAPPEKSGKSKASADKMQSAPPLNLEHTELQA
ncbi:Ankyrin repeat domain-containing protein 23 [Nymphon striatum]|nr:Ankyrin repeat domain-containing protein 23 [Nymphon striatum]